MAKMKINLYQLSADAYKVIRLQNTVDYSIGEVIDKDEAMQLACSRRCSVIIEGDSKGKRGAGSYAESNIN